MQKESVDRYFLCEGESWTIPFMNELQNTKWKFFFLIVPELQMQNAINQSRFNADSPVRC